MKLLLYGINYAPELTGIGKYSGDMAPWFASQQHAVHVITAPPYYPDWQVQSDFHRWWWQRSQEYGVHVTRCPLYVPRAPSARTRLVHLASFALSSFFPLLVQWRWNPDVVVLIVPTLFCAPGTLLLAWLCRAPCVLHVQDFEADALFGLGMSQAGFLRRMAFGFERWLLRCFTRVSTISSGMLKRAEQKGVASQRLLFFPNWSELGHFEGATPSPALLQQLGVPAGRRVLLYSGNIGEKQGLDLLLDAALALREREDLYFLLVGEGAGKPALLKRASRLGLSNLGFAPLQPWELVPALLASAAVHLVIQKRGAADVVLPSKLTNILAVGGNSVITADADTTLGLLCAEHPGIATLVEPESLEGLLAGIEQALQLPVPNVVAQEYAREHLDKERVLRRFERDLLDLVAEGRG